MLFDHPDFDAHEQVIFCSDATTGLNAIIALHSTALGPAAGGCRMHPYTSEAEALTDVLRLSRGMTYKNSLAGLPLGGGKCVIIADPNDPRKPELLRTFATHVQLLAGRYWTAIDIGVGPEDADILAERCDYIFARASQYEPGFNPSAFTALGGFMGIKAVAEASLGRADLKGLRVGVQGLGATAMPCRDICTMPGRNWSWRMSTMTRCVARLRNSGRRRLSQTASMRQMSMYSHLVPLVPD